MTYKPKQANYLNKFTKEITIVNQNGEDRQMRVSTMLTNEALVVHVIRLDGDVAFSFKIPHDAVFLHEMILEEVFDQMKLHAFAAVAF